MEQLNNKQIEVINSSGPVLCIAGAGTGKTRVLTYKIYDLIKKGINKSDILYINFEDLSYDEIDDYDFIEIFGNRNIIDFIH